MDLNEFPPEFDYDFLNESIANPSYCTQAPLCDASLRGSEQPIGESCWNCGTLNLQQPIKIDVTNHLALRSSQLFI